MRGGYLALCAISGNGRDWIALWRGLAGDDKNMPSGVSGYLTLWYQQPLALNSCAATLHITATTTFQRLPA